MRGVVVIALALGIAIPARAQPGPPPVALPPPPGPPPRALPPPPGPPPPPPIAGQPLGPTATGAARVKHRLREKRALDLVDALGLDDKVATRVFAVLARFDDALDGLLVQRAELQRRLTAADQLKDPKALDKLLDEAVANQRALWEVEDHRVTELRAVLTPQQTARLLVVLPAIERRIQRELRRALR